MLPDILAAPILPDQLVAEAIPGNIRRAEHFLTFMQDLVKHLKKRLKTNHVVSLKPIPFLTGLREDTGQSPKTLKFTYSRLNSLMKTLEILGKGFLFFIKNCCSVLIVYFLELISFIIVVSFEFNTCFEKRK